MIRIEKTEVYGWEAAIRGMRNPMNSWDKSDTDFGKYYIDFLGFVVVPIGKNDLALMKKLIKAGSDHRKFMRQIFVSLDITAPLYWWKEFDTYKVGTTANSCSTMHKIHAKEFELSDFSWERLDEPGIKLLEAVIDYLNTNRNAFNDTQDKSYWDNMIQSLPSSYEQKRTVTLNYEVLLNMYHARKNHKLVEWREFCKWIETLPYSELITE